MKKILLPGILLTLVFQPNMALWAKEEPPANFLSVLPQRGETAETMPPFEVSLATGEWSQAQPGKVFTTGTHAPDFTLPFLKEPPVPIRYPRWAVQEGWEGTFVIAVEVLKTGKVGRWTVTQSTGYPLLDKVATEAIRQWHFYPATEQGRLLVSCIQIPVRFNLTTHRKGVKV